MEFSQILHTNKGLGETSYANNSSLQRQIISAGKEIMEEAVAQCYHNTLRPQSMGIADLGCSSGPNTLIVISNIINTIYNTICFDHDHDQTVTNKLILPELRVSLNDLPGNDFNSVFILLPEFYKQLKKEKGIGRDGCFVSGVAGSFYGRLFPKNSLHFVHSSTCLHWLSQSPPALEMNKGNIYLSKTSPACVAEAYLLQFQIDFFAFLRSRAEETVAFAGMLLSFVGRSSTHHSADQMVARSFELLSQALKSMAYEGFVEEDKIDSFNLPYYDAHAEEVRNVIQKEGSFLINHLEAFEINWYEDDINNCDYDELKKLSRGEQWSRTVRAVVEPMLESHFGGGIMDELFSRHGKLVEDNLLRTRPKLINLMISVTRKP